ncbi:MAG: alpha/beta hydrolase, partial [Planctomycetes bacterium]|nr:alpha/beta hydrolase [Planctomycetota bacterium]
MRLQHGDNELTVVTTTFVPANGRRFEVDQCGDGDRLALCLHGFPECSFSWRYQLPLLARLGYTAWAPNLRGYGRSSRPTRINDYALDHLVADVAGLIDAAGKRSTVLIAHDWGAALAWNLALRGIRPLERLIILNLPHPALFFKNLFRFPQVLRSWYIFFFQIPFVPEWLFGLNGAQAIADAFRDMAIDKSRFPDEVLEVYRRQALQPGALTAMLNWYRALLRHLPSSRQVERIERTVLEVPTLMLWGECDTALGKELTYGTEERVRDFTLRYLPNVSHW